MPDTPIKTVTLFDNGMVAVFDRYGSQVAALQGAFADVCEAILARADGETVFRVMYYRQGRALPLSREEWLRAGRGPRVRVEGESSGAVDAHR
jgi:hypothetical protein